jgi:polysaccharide biosynthesis transport protein
MSGARTRKVGGWGCLLALLLAVGALGGIALLFGVCLIGTYRFACAEKYTASSILRMAMQEGPIAFAASPMVAGDKDRFDIYKATQQQLVTSRFVVLAALRKPEVAKLPVIQSETRSGDPVRWLQRHVSVGFPGKAELMEVSLTCNDPKEAVTLLGAVVEAYLAEVVNAERDQKRQRLSELDRAYVQKETEVRAKREDLRKLAEQLGTSDPETLALKQKLALEELTIYRTEVARAQSEIRHLLAELAVQKARLKRLETEHVSPAEIDELAEKDPVTRQLRTELDWKKIDQAEDHERHLKELRTLQKQYESRLDDLREVVQQRRRRDIEEEMVRLETSVTILQEQLGGLAKNVAKQQAEIEKFATASVDIDMMRADIKNLDSVMASIAQEREKLKVEIRAAPRVTILQRAEVAEPTPH